MTEKKIKVLTISDHPLSPSGVGTQTKYMIEALLKSGKFEVFSMAGAIKHDQYDAQYVEPYGKDWVIQPVDGYGNPEAIRSLVRTYRPDILWFMTDPRFWEWLWAMDNEIRSLVPMVYYPVWDNLPLPMYNKKFYESNDFIATISKVTDGIVKGVAPDVDSKYIPHAVESQVFKPLEKEEISKYKKEFLKDENKFVIFWNNRNARRKSTGSLIKWYKTFYDGLSKEEQENVVLLMHTDPSDAYGQDINIILKDWGFRDGQVLISQAKVPPENLAVMYNMADITVNVSDAEGFGLATLESLSCGTPIIVTMTGGLQEQVTDGEEYFGVGIEPCAKAVIGSQQVPYIYEDRISEEDFVDALDKMYRMSQEERDELGKKGREHVLKNYNFEDFEKTWVNTMVKINKDHGSWENRKKYKNWKLLEL